MRHNLRLIADACKVDLDGLAREAKALEDRKKWVASEDPRLRRKVEDEAECEVDIFHCDDRFTDNMFSNTTIASYTSRR